MTCASALLMDLPLHRGSLTCAHTWRRQGPRLLLPPNAAQRAEVAAPPERGADQEVVVVAGVGDGDVQVATGGAADDVDDDQPGADQADSKGTWSRPRTIRFTAACSGRVRGGGRPSRSSVQAMTGCG